ncbi:MAG TPA: TRAP transporter substrate-binding protein [Hyphomicrobiaceae bacterium]|nr:TRAP transporter substrate-binding protein [Hyphomicrobiaceae bacterium]
MLLRCGGYQGEDSVHTRALRALKAEIGRAVSGVEIELTPNVTAQGRKASDLLALVESGDLDLCYFSSSYLAGRVPSLRVLDLPFLVTQRARAYRALDGDLGKRLADDIGRATGFCVLAYWDNGFRHFSNGLRPIRHPRDCQGMKIRTLDNALHQQVFRALGFEPITIDVKDMPAAIASGAVDAQENPLTNTLNFGLHRTHRYISMTSHFFGVALLLGNRAKFDGWSTDTRQLVGKAVATATHTQRGYATSEDVDCLARLQADGCAIASADAIDLCAFEAAVADIRAAEIARLDPALRRAW